MKATDKDSTVITCNPGAYEKCWRCVVTWRMRPGVTLCRLLQTKRVTVFVINNHCVRFSKALHSVSLTRGVERDGFIQQCFLPAGFASNYKPLPLHIPLCAPAKPTAVDTPEKILGRKETPFSNLLYENNFFCTKIIENAFFKLLK